MTPPNRNIFSNIFTSEYYHTKMDEEKFTIKNLISCMGSMEALNLAKIKKMYKNIDLPN